LLKLTLVDNLVEVSTSSQVIFMNKSENKFLVISGASRGIGRGIVESFANNNYKVFYSYKNDKTIENDNVIPIKADFSNTEEVEYFFSKIKQHTSKIDCLVNNVGIARFILLASQSHKDFDLSVSTNCKSLFLSYKHSIPFLNRGSSIINISSISSIKPKKGDGIYATTKSFINTISRFMQSELEHKFVSVHTIFPGFVLTEKLQEPQYESIRKNNFVQIPLGRFSSPKEIGKLVFFLSKLQYCNIEIPITGGQHLT